MYQKYVKKKNWNHIISPYLSGTQAKPRHERVSFDTLTLRTQRRHLRPQWQLTPLLLSFLSFFLKTLLLPGTVPDSCSVLPDAALSHNANISLRIRAPAADVSAQRLIYLNLWLAMALLLRASPGASPACLRIHSHLSIKLLTLMLLVMFGAAPTLEPIKLHRQRVAGVTGVRRTWFRRCLVE